MISCVILAAGLSQRFGSPKALAKLNNDLTVIEFTQNQTLTTAISEIVIVLGSQADEIKPFILKHKKIKVVYNKDYNFGQTSSFKVGLDSCSLKANGIMLLPVDCPLVKPSTIDEIIQDFDKNPALITIPAYQEKKGHPPIFSSKLKEEILSLDNDCGLNSVAKTKHAEDTRILEVSDAGVIAGFNTPQEFDRIKESI